MKVYSRSKEKLLSYIGYRPDHEKRISWRELLYIYLQSWAGWLVNADQIFERGLDVEELTLVLTDDQDKAWEAAQPYYDSAKSKGHAKAYYRIAMRWAQDDRSEFLYGHYLEEAAKRGYLPAVQDFVKYYDEFKVRTITKDAWKRKHSQEKLFFRCCKILADNNDTIAMWEMGTCYLLGTGVKKDVAKGLYIRDCAIEKGHFSPESKERLIETQNEFKNAVTDKRTHYNPLTALKELFSIESPEK